MVAVMRLPSVESMYRSAQYAFQCKKSRKKNFDHCSQSGNEPFGVLTLLLVDMKGICPLH